MSRGRKKIDGVDDAWLEQLMQGLTARIDKIVGVRNGMKALDLSELPVDYITAANNAMDDLNKFCDGALQKLRDKTSRDDRTWDKWD